MPSWMIWAFVGCTGLRSAQREVVVRPDDPASWTELGDAYRQRLRRKSAQEAYARALEIDINYEPAQAGLSRTRRRAGNNKIVRAALQNPTDDELWGDAADYYMSVGLRDEALSAYTYALELDPTDSEWQRAILGLAGVDAILEILHAQGQDMGDEGLGDIGDILREAGRTEEACATYQRALALDPTDEEWTQRMAECNGGTISAMPPNGLNFNQAGGEGPAVPVPGGINNAMVEVLRSRVFSNPELLRELGMAHAQAGELGDAEKYLHSSLLLRPSDASTLELYVAVTGRTRGEILEQLAEEVPDNDELIGELGDQMLYEGRPQEALIYYKRALSIDEDDPEWTSKASLLEEILSHR